MVKHMGKICRFSTMLVLTFGFFIAEITVGYRSNCLAIISDSYHMISDVLALAIGLASVRVSKMTSEKNTYGWARSEVLGALVNSVFLTALCFTIFIEALQRFSKLEVVTDPILLCIVGAIGTALNIVGIFVFGCGEGGECHSHGSGARSRDKGEVVAVTKSSSNGECKQEQITGNEKEGNCNDKPPISGDETENGAVQIVTTSTSDTVIDDDESEHHKHNSGQQLNMRSAYLHAIGDFFGTLAILFSGLVYTYVEDERKYYLDPVLSLVLVGVILSTALPLLRESALILLQTVPGSIQVKELQDKLQRSVKGVLGVHEFHVWQLAGNKVIATLHFQCQGIEYKSVLEEVKYFFHMHGVHSITVQGEFVEHKENCNERDCLLECGPDKDCFADTCCFRKVPKAEDNPGLRQRRGCHHRGHETHDHKQNQTNGTTEQNMTEVVTVQGKVNDAFTLSPPYESRTIS